MSLAEEVEALSRIPMFADVERGQLQLLAFTSERVRFAPGETLFCQREVADAAYVILEGTADVEVDSPSGPITVATVERHQIVGEIAILCDVPRTAAIRATSELAALRISKDVFFRLVMEFPQVGFAVMRELATRLDRTTRELRAARGG